MEFLKQLWRTSGTVRAVVCVVVIALCLAASASEPNGKNATSPRNRGLFDQIEDFATGAWNKMPWVKPKPGIPTDSVETATEIAAEATDVFKDGLDQLSP